MAEKFPVFSHVDLRVPAPLPPLDASEMFVIEVTGTIQVVIEGSDEFKPAGTIKLLKVLAVAAYDAGTPLRDVCDSHTDFLVAAYHAIFDKDGEAKAELEIEPGWSDMLVLWEFDVPLAFRHGLALAFEAAIAALGSLSLVVAAIEKQEGNFIGLELTAEEWRQLGFRRVAGTQFAFRDNCRVNPYA
jgi:hypothetical protein